MPLQVFCRNCAQYRHEWCDLKVDSPDPDLARDCQYYSGTTNADRIRSMTDEELAEWLAKQEYRRVAFDGWLPLCNHVMGPRTCHENGCEKCWLDWLKREVGE